MTARPQQHRFTEVTTRHNLPAWQTLASCRDKDPDLWFPSDGTGHKAKGEEAKLICSGCPVKEACLEFGLFQPEGIWGGADEKTRRRMRRRKA